MPETGSNHITAAVTNLIDETFDITQSESYHLSIQTHSDGLAFCIFNTIINKYIVLRHYSFSASGTDDIHTLCKDIFLNDDLLRLKYKSCSHLWISPRCTLMPEHLFDQANIAHYLSFNHGWNANESVLKNYIVTAKLYNIFSYPKNMISLLQSWQPSVTFYHHASPFIDSTLTESLPSGKIHVAIYYYGGFLDIAIVKSKKLLFYNTFGINAPEDSIYYLAAVLNLFDLKLADTKLLYAGTLNNIPPQIEILRKYVDRIIESESFDSVIYSHYLTRQLRARFVHLFNLYRCVS